MSNRDPNLKGNVAELKIAAEAARLGIPVLRPMTEHERYDLVFELDGELKRVQCKSAPRKGDVVAVRFVANRRGPNGFIRTKYTADEIDAVAAYCPGVGRVLPDSLRAHRADDHHVTFGSPRRETANERR